MNDKEKRAHALHCKCEHCINESDRKTVLLKATYDLLNSCGLAAEEIVFYDGAECDGYCLMEDIAIELELNE